MKLNHLLGIVIAAAFFFGIWSRLSERKSTEPRADRFDSLSGQSGKVIQPVIGAGKSEEWGYLGLHIHKVHEKQKSLDASPWHADGGDWTFLECTVSIDPTVRVLIGVRAKGAAEGDVPVSWGEARLIAFNRAGGADFVETFAKAFRTKVPSGHGDKPPGFIRLNTAILGSQLAHDPVGGFKGRGSWTATKWFFPEDSGEAELFFNYSIDAKLAEFSEKDEEYREDLIEQLVIGLRDGPLPERTIANDPNLTLTGPKVRNWTRVASSSETCQFTPNADALVVTASESGVKARIYTSPIQNPSERKLLAQFDSSVVVHQFLKREPSFALFVVEAIHKNPKIYSSDDPQRAWLVDENGKREIVPPNTLTNWIASPFAISPDGKFVALLSWNKGKKPNRVISLGNLTTGEWRKVEIPETPLELIGWQERSTAVILTGLEFPKDQPRKPYLLDALTGKLSPLDSVPPEFAQGRERSPGGKRFVRVVEKDRLVIEDAPGVAKREFVFHPYDRRNVDRDSVKWANDRYLVFQGLRTALIDAETLKMNYPVEKDDAVQAIDFSANFKLALGANKEGKFLGRVESAE